jgi:hypothetical protein
MSDPAPTNWDGLAADHGVPVVHPVACIAPTPDRSVNTVRIPLAPIASGDWPIRPMSL